jgi:hypothetical protein
MYAIKLLKIHCSKHSSTSGNDDLYVTFQMDGGDKNNVPPTPSTYHSWDIDEGQEKALQPSSTLQDGKEVKGSELIKMFQNTVRVELWDYDSMSSDDSLGAFDVTAGEGEGSFSKDVTGDGGLYTVGYTVKMIDV